MTCAIFNPKPFAEGRFRLAYKGEWKTQEKEGKPCVIKRMKSGAVVTPGSWDCTLKIQNRANNSSSIQNILYISLILVGIQ